MLFDPATQTKTDQVLGCESTGVVCPPQYRCCCVEAAYYVIQKKQLAICIWVFPIIVVPPKWMVKIMENPIKMDDLGVPLFLETPISIYFCFCLYIFSWLIYRQNSTVTERMLIFPRTGDPFSFAAPVSWRAESDKWSWGIYLSKYVCRLFYLVIDIYIYI